MKKIITLTFLALSFSTFACPNLSGIYTCTTPEIPGGDPYEVTVEQDEQAYTEILENEDGTESTITYLLDGKNHRSAFGIKYKATCKEELKMTFRAFLFTKSWTKYVITDYGFEVLRRESKRGTYKSFKVCKK